MSQLRRYGRDLLDASRRRRTPSPERKHQLIEQLVSAAAQTAHDAPTRPPLAQRLSPRAKVVVLFALLSAVAVGLYLASAPR
jgi:hypothetical protein